MWSRNNERKRPLTDEELLQALDDSDLDIDDDDSVVDKNFQPNYSDVDSSEDEGFRIQERNNKEEAEESNEEDEIGNEIGSEDDNGNFESITQDAEHDTVELEELDEEPSTSRTPQNKRKKPNKDKNKKQVTKGTQKKQPKHPKQKWGAWNLSPDFPVYDEINYDVGERHDWSPIDYFSNYYDEQFFVVLASQTNIYYLQQRGRLLGTDATEMKRYLGISLTMSALGYPRIAMYWQSNFQVPLISANMTRDRFFTLRNHVHLVNNLDVTQEQRDADRVWKVRPLIDAFRRVVLTLPREENMCIDEQMIPFAGAVGIRQYVPRKPNPTGIKVYILGGASGQVLDFEVYQGATTRLPPEVDGTLKLGAGGRAILRLAETCPPGTNLYFDRFFTGTALLEKLQEKGISGTGTIMANRFPNVGLKTDATLKQEGRGSTDFKVREDKKIAIVKWMDNRSVTLASTKHSPTAGGSARRYSKPDKAYIEIPRPAMIERYNTNMGGVDLLNRLIACYRSYHRTKKWPVRVLEHFMDMTVVNCWLQYSRDCKFLKIPKRQIMDLLKFKLRISECLILGADTKIRVVESEAQNDEHENDREPPRKKSRGRPPTVALPPQERRTFGAIHLPEALDLPSAPRCRKPYCNHRSRVRCSACKAFFCVVKERNCFKEFHS